MKRFDDESVDTVLYDPPFSSRQVSECYKKFCMTVNRETTQNSYWRRQKEQISRIVRPDGIVISFGWNSGGIGKKYGFEKLHIRLIAHGGNHNDTIITVERKLQLPLCGIKAASRSPPLLCVFYSLSVTITKRPFSFRKLGFCIPCARAISTCRKSTCICLALGQLTPDKRHQPA